MHQPPHLTFVFTFRVSTPSPGVVFPRVVWAPCVVLDLAPYLLDTGTPHSCEDGAKYQIKENEGEPGRAAQAVRPPCGRPTPENRR